MDPLINTRLHWIAKGRRQKERLDFYDTCSHVTRITSIRVLIATAALYNIEIHQMDIKTTLLNCDSKKEIYREQLEGFIVSNQENKVCKLLYGLNQGPKQWYQKFDKKCCQMDLKLTSVINVS